jgi:hypothetical protein
LFDCNNNIKELMKIILFAVAVFAAYTEVNSISLFNLNFRPLCKPQRWLILKV